MEKQSKGRDWYDLEWYIKKGIPLDRKHFLQRAIDTGDWNKKTITEKQILQLLKDKINTVSLENVKEDLFPFIKNDKTLEIWSTDYFMDLIEKMRFE